MPDTATRPVPLPAPSAQKSERSTLVAAVLLCLLALILWVPRWTAVPASDPTPSKRASPAPKSSAPSASRSGPIAALFPAPPGRLRIDFDYPFRSGTLRVYLDDELALEQELTGQQRKKALVFKSHSGSFSEALEVPPGLHEVRVEVRWEDNTRRERLIGRFRPGTTHRLEASLGRIRRDLNLEWK